MKCKFVFVINNVYKLEEVFVILGDKVELFSLNDINCYIDILEIVEIFEGNVYFKLFFIYWNYGLNCFVDDMGLEVELLGGVLGIYLVCYVGGEGYNVEVNMLKFFYELEGKDNCRV